MNTQLIMDYLSALDRNNNREWYHQHKAEYKEANAQFEELVQELILAIGKTDGSIIQNVPKDLTFKLVRDTRFSHDKSPYNPAFRAPFHSGIFLFLPSHSFGDNVLPCVRSHPQVRALLSLPDISDIDRKSVV